MLHYSCNTLKKKNLRKNGKKETKNITFKTLFFKNQGPGISQQDKTVPGLSCLTTTPLVNSYFTQDDIMDFVVFFTRISNLKEKMKRFDPACRKVHDEAIC